MALDDAYYVTLPEVVAVIVVSAYAGAVVLLLWLRRPRLRLGRRCPRCLRLWRHHAEDGWAALERQARLERQQQ